MHQLTSGDEKKGYQLMKPYARTRGISETPTNVGPIKNGKAENQLLW